MYFNVISKYFFETWKNIFKKREKIIIRVFLLNKTQFVTDFQYLWRFRNVGTLEKLFLNKTHFMKEKKMWAKGTFSSPEENDRRGLAPYGEGLGSIWTFLWGVWARHSIFLVPTLFKPFSMLYKIGYTSYLGKCSFIYI